MNIILKPCGIQDTGQIQYLGIKVNEKYVAEIIYMPDYQTNCSNGLTIQTC